MRNAQDMNCLAVPPKYRQLGDFHEYYSGTRRAPYLTLFIGGNHEASNHLTELFYGGWVAPNIYYMGAANVLRLGGLRIAGMSGIWKGYDFKKNHFERVPYRNGQEKSVYHVRKVDTRKLLQLKTQIDIGVSHDWPRGVEWKGQHQNLFRFKKHLEDDARKNQLGSAVAKDVMDHLRPPHWFSAHLHVKYAAIINHKKPNNPDAAIHNNVTRFLALDKCLPKHQFLQLLEIPVSTERPVEKGQFFDDGRPRLSYDPEWLAITRTFADTIEIGGDPEDVYLEYKNYESQIAEELRWVHDNVVEPGKLSVPDNFEIVAPIQTNATKKPRQGEMPEEYPSPQMEAFCELLDIPNPLHSSDVQEEGILGLPTSNASMSENKQKRKALDLPAPVNDPHQVESSSKRMALDLPPPKHDQSEEKEL